MQYSAKGALEGGYVDTQRLRISLRAKLNECLAQHSEASAAAHAVSQSVAAKAQECQQAETEKLKRYKEEKAAAAATGESAAAAERLRAEVWPGSWCLCMCSFAI